MSQFRQYKRKLRWKSTIRKHGGDLPWWHDPSEEEDALYGRDLGPQGMDPSCPKCGSPMYWRDAAGLTGMHPEGAWECSNQRCWNMLTPGELAPDIVPTTMDPNWKPDGWDAPEPYSPSGHRCPMCKSHRLIEQGNSLICPECNWAGEKFQPPKGFQYPESSE